MHALQLLPSEESADSNYQKNRGNLQKNFPTAARGLRFER